MGNRAIGTEKANDRENGNDVARIIGPMGNYRMRGEDFSAKGYVLDGGVMRRAGAAAPAKPAGTPKFRNVPCENAAGEKYASKLEMAVCAALRARYGADRVLRQVSIPIGAGNRLRLDFLIIENIRPDGSFVGWFADAKGVATDAWTAKARHLKDKYSIEVLLIKKPGEVMG